MINSSNVMSEIQNPKNWKKTHKKSYEVYVCRPLPGAQCTNRLEGSHYVTDQNKQFIISGTVGETWVIDVNKLAKTYTFADETPITPDTLRAKCDNSGQMDWQRMKTRADAANNYAFFLPKSIQNFPVNTSWGDTLLANRPGIGHGLGDFLVCSDMGGQPNLNDVWVVNGEIFPKTYDLHAFPNMFPPTVTQAETPRPQVRFMKKAPTLTEIDKIVNALAQGLKNKGHVIGKKTNDSIETKSFSIDNGAYGIIVNLGDNGKYVSIMANTTGEWSEVAGWFLDDNSLQSNIERIHNITSGSRKANDLTTRLEKELGNSPDTVFINGNDIESHNGQQAQKSADKFYDAALRVASKLGFSKVTKSDWDGYTARVEIEAVGVNGGGIVDFQGGTKGYACFLEDWSNETNGTDLDITNKESVKRALMLIYSEFKNNKSN